MNQFTIQIQSTKTGPQWSHTFSSDNDETARETTELYLRNDPISRNVSSVTLLCHENVGKRTVATYSPSVIFETSVPEGALEALG